MYFIIFMNNIHLNNKKIELICEQCLFYFFLLPFNAKKDFFLNLLLYNLTFDKSKKNLVLNLQIKEFFNILKFKKIIIDIQI